MWFFRFKTQIDLSLGLEIGQFLLYFYILIYLFVFNIDLFTSQILLSYFPKTMHSYNKDLEFDFEN